MGTYVPAESAPWITFRHNPSVTRIGLHLGEAFSKCEHVGQALVPPKVVETLTSIYLARGALATTAIEGNTLSEEQAKAIIDGIAHTPPSQEYLEKEILNVAAAIEAIDDSARSGARFVPTPEWIREQNAAVLEGLDVADHVVPGEYTSKQVVVGRYKAAHPRDVPQLVEDLCRWLEEEWLAPSRDPKRSRAERFTYRFHAAALAHLYIAWIHPFGDGNGRTARLLECAILAHSDVVPWISSNLLSDHFNKTRSRYYQKLDNASRRGEVEAFVEYAAQGFVDQLREQIVEVREYGRFAAWQHYVWSRLHDEPSGKAKDRRRDLALILADRDHKPVSKSEIPELNTLLARAYANVDPKTVTRDLTRLYQLGLVKRLGRGRAASFDATIDDLEAFKPLGLEP